MRPTLAAALAAALGCTSVEEHPSSAAAASFCEPGVRDCASLPGYEVSCVSGFCAARSLTGEVRFDCLGRGEYANDLASDPLHCGACGRACAAGERCQGSVCRAPCLPPRRECGGVCADLEGDDMHCGRCGNACAAGSSCRAGACRPPCPGGLTACGADCVHLPTSLTNCGACGRRCSPRSVCTEGSCVSVCRGGTSECDGDCHDLASDPSHCGACGVRCPAGRPCVAGACAPCAPGVCPPCAAGLTACDGLCVDLRSAAANCGACGRRCLFDNGCHDGRCVHPCAYDPLTATARGAYAATFEVSPDNCGACDVRCPSDAACLDGRCVGASPRMIAPLSTAVVTSARPWFRWEPAAGAEGTQIEVCSTRACDLVEHRWDVTGGRFRPTVALRGGVHFWRARSRRAGAVSAPGGVVWEFAVPTSAGARGEPTGAIVDVNGDGRVDLIGPSDRTPGGASPTAVEVYLGGPAGPPAAPSQRVSLADWHIGEFTSAGAWRPTYVGDVNGDGYGDVSVMRGERQYGPTVYGEWFRYYPVILYGGPAGLRPTQHFAGDLYSESNIAYALSGPQGDRNGDGYGDAASESYAFAHTSPLLVGGPYAEAAPVSYTTYPSVPGGRYHVGDFDADGRSEVVLATQRAGGDPGAPLLLLLGLAGRVWDTPTSEDLSGCGVGALTAEQTRSDLRVADFDDDGYDDLALWTGATPTARVVFRGGPGGLQRDRCERDP